MLEEFVLEQGFVKNFHVFWLSEIWTAVMYSWRGLIPYITEDTWRDTGQWHFGKPQRALAHVELYQLYWAA